MKGAQTYNITQADGSLFTVQWDNVVSENIFIRFTATSIDGVNPPKIALILQQLPILLVPSIGAVVNVNQVQAAVQEIDPNTLVTNAGLSTAVGGPFTNTLTPTALNYQFQVLGANIIITPIVILPTTSNRTAGQTVQFSATGGTQLGYGWSLLVNNSGGSITGPGGLYTAGATPGVDTIQVIDSGGNTATVQVTVS